MQKLINRLNPPSVSQAQQPRLRLGNWSWLRFVSRLKSLPPFPRPDPLFPFSLFFLPPTHPLQPHAPCRVSSSSRRFYTFRPAVHSNSHSFFVLLQQPLFSSRLRLAKPSLFFPRIHSNDRVARNPPIRCLTSTVAQEPVCATINRSALSY
jgi:hypothetical protein